MDKIQEICDASELQGHIAQNCQTLFAVQEVLNEQVYTFNTIPQPANNPYF